VAHEINNPLAVAMANLDFMVKMLQSLRAEIRTRQAGERLGGGPGAGWFGWLEGRLGEIDEPLVDAREAVDRIRGIVRDVKLFSRSQDDHTGPIDVQRVVESSLRLAWNEIRHRAKLVKQYAEAPKVDANESRLGQVVLNLIVNAAQSMQEGSATQNEIRVVTKTTDAGWAMIEISDTGSGIRPEDLDRIFDPFFTTKPVGVGTGLGLAICHRIVTDLNGRIEVETVLGKGTSFRILLPSTRGEVARATPVVEHARVTRRGRILVVDDEVGIGRAIRRSLSPHHDVTALTNAEEALALIAQGTRFDVILSDVMMPEVTGLEFHERLSVLSPDQATRIIFLTGGAFTTKAREFLDRMPNRRIEKPFDMAALLSVLGGVIDQG
ncbi:MAG: ATP-binding protein, partial [Polyangiaceae bacterium]